MSDETKPRIRNIIKRTTLIVRDMQATRRWYEEVLGMSVWMDTEFTLSGDGIAIGNPGDRTHLMIMQAEDPKIGMIGFIEWLEPKMDMPPVPTVTLPGMPIFVVETDDATEIANRAKALGTKVFAEPHEWSTRGARGEMKYFIGTSLFDPDGYIFECNQVTRIEEPEE